MGKFQRERERERERQEDRQAEGGEMNAIAQKRTKGRRSREAVGERKGRGNLKGEEVIAIE